MSQGKPKGYRNTTSQSPSVRRAAGAEEKPGMTPEMMLDTIVDFLKRRGLSAFFLGILLGGTLSGVAYHMLPPAYTAVASITIQSPENRHAERFKQTQMDMITSPRVLNAALNDPEAKALPFVQNSNQPTQELQKRVKFVTEVNSELVNVTMTGVDPKELQILVNAIVKAYLEQSKEVTNVNAAQQEQLLEERLRDVEREIKRLRGEQVVYASKAGDSDPNAVKIRYTQVLANLERKREQLKAAQLALPALKNDLENLRSTTPKLTIEQETALQSYTRNADVLNAEKALKQMEIAAEAIRKASVQGERDVEYIRRKQFIDEQRKQIDEEMELNRERFLRRLEEQRTDQINKLKGDIKVQEELIRQLDTDRLALEAEERELQILNAEIEIRNKEIAALEKTRTDYTTELQNVRLARDSKYISLVGLADLPRLPSTSKKRLLAIVGGGAGGFGLVVMLFWFFDFRRKLISRPEHLHRQLSLPVLGTLPMIPRGVRIPTDRDFDGSSKSQRQWIAMQEAINALRITLTFAPDRHEDGLSSLMITSPRDGEGKSTVTAQLALSLARSGVRVVVVEADMHRPTQSETFEVERNPGLADVLEGTISVAEAIRETKFPGLDVLTAGTPSTDMTALLVADRLQPVFDYLREKYDTVLVDAPPTLPVYDAMLFGRLVDRTLLCAMCNHSQLYAVEQAQERLESIGIPIMGLVVTAAPSPPKYYDNYYRSEGYRAYASLPKQQPKPEANSHTNNGSSKGKSKAKV